LPHRGRRPARARAQRPLTGSDVVARHRGPRRRRGRRAHDLRSLSDPSRKVAPVVAVKFTNALQRHVAAPPGEVDASTVRAALDAYFADHSGVRGYVLDEQGALRKHVTVFVDGEQVRDRSLHQPIAAGAEIYVMQALSGGMT